ncbi:AMP-binding protein [Nonomuraea sp. NPDC050556]|uniref:AMP-binding protein n=1 Tax=Nonomuraea sp. NPDC050556 TaxID=3364369 RepID=UPI00378C2050
MGGTALDVFGSTPLRTSPVTPLGSETSPGTQLGTDTPPRSSQPETTGGVTGLEPLGVRPGGGWACFTSGSSGRPRAVVRSRESWTGSFTHLNALTGIGPDDTVLVPGPLNSSLYGFAAVHALGTGATAILPGRWSLADIDDATVVHTVPHLLPQVLPSNVRTVIVGGAALDPTMRDSRVISYYGATELSFVAIDVDGRGLRPFPEVEIEVRAGEVWVRSPWVADGYLINPDNPPHRTADNPPHRDADNPPHRDADNPPHRHADGLLYRGASGPPRQDADAPPHSAADGPLHCDTGSPLSRDPDGLLQRDANDPPLRDPGDPLRRAADGPLYRDADGPLRRDAQGWLTVGDLGAYEPGGVLRLRGRGAGAIQTGGATVVAEDVEAVLRRVPGVVDVVVVGSPHPHLGAVVTAIVEGTASRAALEEAARAGLDPAQRPRRWHTAERLPRTPTGKPARDLTADAFERLR